VELDCIIVGGGLHGTLLALALRDRRIALVESGSSLGGNHLWSFHTRGLPSEAAALLEPLIVARWPAYQVAFPDRVRVVDEPYASVSSERLDHVARQELGPAVLLRTKVSRIDARGVELADGRVLEAPQIFDCRGPESFPLRGAHAFQKFCGIELEGAHSLELPTLMDARVEQRDGFRFFYVLPLAPDRVLVEDTRFSETAALDIDAVEQDALAWARSQGLNGAVVRREAGVLPLPLDVMPRGDRLGYGGGFFHPVTGYSLPLAVRIAIGKPPRALQDQQRFALLLNRLLYRATAPEHRWRVLSRFHALPGPLILRFHDLETTRADRLRILCGRPPRGVSLRRALEALA